MKSLQYTVVGIIFSLVLLISQQSLAKGVDKATVAASGYDVVSYFKNSGPVPGTGYHVSEHDGVTYLFANKDNKKTFDKNPENFIPAYGGFCAYGVAVGKKFYSSPLAWHIDNDRLYLNLDKEIQNKWLKDVPGYIEKGDKNWKEISDKSAGEL